MSKLILHVKGLEQSAYDSRAASSMALAYATSDIGAHHTRAWTIAKEVEQGANWTDEDRVNLVIYHQSLRPLFDMLGVCRLPWIELGLNEQHYARFYSAVTGKETTLAELLEKSNNIYSLTRLINNRLGLTRKDDALPYKVHACPIQTGATAGKVIDREKFERPARPVLPDAAAGTPTATRTPRSNNSTASASPPPDERRCGARTNNAEERNRIPPSGGRGHGAAWATPATNRETPGRESERRTSAGGDGTAVGVPPAIGG